MCCSAAGRSTIPRLSSRMDLASRLFSPYDLNPGGSNPLREILAETIDFERLAQAPIKLFVTATNVRPAAATCSATARSRRTCCSPRPACRRCSRRSRSTASPIGTAATAGNPTITPLVRECDVAGHHPGPDQPGRAAGHAAHRRATSSIGSTRSRSTPSLLKELRMIALLRQVADPGECEGARGRTCASTASPATR